MLPDLDQYGGLKALPSPKGGTGYFRLEKFGNRWLLVDPEGNAFWFLGVADTGMSSYPPDADGKSYRDYMVAKYGDGEAGLMTWSSQIKKRLLSWGFNALGMYEGPTLRSYGNFGRQPVKPFLPFLHMHVLLASASMANKNHYIPSAVKNIRATVPPGGTFPDVFDPGFEAYAFASMKADSQSDTNGIKDELLSPWIVAYISDESDDFNGFNSASSLNPGWAALATAPTQQGRQYSDPKVYTKFAFQSFLEDRYNKDIRALNTAWASSYTTFDSDRGYGIGQGWLDEDGRRHKWVGDQSTLAGETPAMQKDVNDFLYLIARRYFQVAHDAIKSVDKNHLYFGMVSLTESTPQPVLRGAKDYVDALVVELQSLEQRGADGALLPMAAKSPSPDIYNLTGRPLLAASLFIDAEPDSPFADSGKQPSQYFAEFDTQEQRGAFYEKYLQEILELAGSDGVHPVIGFHWWALFDNLVMRQNYGLITVQNNAYDGREAVVRRGVDEWGFPTGGEKHDYGDMITHVRKANLEVMSQLVKK